MIKWLASLALGNPWVLGGVAGAFLLATGWAYTKGRLDGARLTTASQTIQTEKVIDGIANVAERARARVRLCAARGLSYDPERGGCVEG